MEFTEDQINRYSRHILLPEVGGKGQKKIAKSRILLVGAGGLGSPAALYLAAAGVGTIGLIDSDVVDLTNLQRQVLHHTPDVGRPKVLSGKEKIQALNPDVNVSMYEERLTAGNALKIFNDYDVVIDGVDNFTAKFLINDACFFAGKPLVHGGILRADKIKTDWLLWVDSDIVLNLEAMQKLWQTADKINRPVVSGVYFISKENEGSLMRPFHVLFADVDEFQVRYHHPLPDNQVIKCDSAGFGFVLMHKSIVPKMREAFPGQSMFMERGDADDSKFVGEDIIFFRRMKKAGIPLHAHTGALVKHMKRFSVDYDYYALYWANEHLKTKLKEQQGE